MKQVIDQLATCLESHPLPALAFPSHAHHVPGISPVAFVQCRFRNSASVSRLIRLTGYLFTVTKAARRLVAKAPRRKKNLQLRQAPAQDLFGQLVDVWRRCRRLPQFRVAARFWWAFKALTHRNRQRQRSADFPLTHSNGGAMRHQLCWLPLQSNGVPVCSPGPGSDTTTHVRAVWKFPALAGSEVGRFVFPSPLIARGGV